MKPSGVAALANKPDPSKTNPHAALTRKNKKQKHKHEAAPGFIRSAPGLGQGACATPSCAGTGPAQNAGPRKAGAPLRFG